MKTKLHYLLALLFLGLSVQGMAQKKSTNTPVNPEKMKTKKVLFVVTSAAVVTGTDKKTGLWIEEFATPYYALKAQGVQITLASPEGGKSPIDPKSQQPEYSTSSVKRFNEDALAQDALDHTLRLEAVDAKDYDAVFYPGGHGPMWDLPDNKHSIALIESFYAQEKPVALVCHAPAALKNVKAKNGEALIKGKKVTGFANSEEIAGQSTDAVPFMLEDMLKEKGGIYSKGSDWQAYAVEEGKLITGQNPASAELVAEKLLVALQSNKK